MPATWKLIIRNLKFSVKKENVRFCVPIISKNILQMTIGFSVTKKDLNNLKNV